MKRRPRLVLVMLVMIGLLAWILYPEPGPFDSGPQVAGGPELLLVPPPLRIPSADCFDDEDLRVLVFVRGKEGELRFSFDPDGAERRVWSLDRQPELGMLELADDSLFRRLLKLIGLASDRIRSPAVVLCSEPDELWHEGPGRENLALRTSYKPRTYLSGVLDDGKLGVVPLAAGSRVSEELIHRGWMYFPVITAAGTHGEGVHIVQVLRRGEVVRIRWGDYPRKKPLGWESGEVVISDSAEGTSGTATGLSALTRLLAEDRFIEDGEDRALVELEIGEETLYRDVLRVVECGGGDPNVIFWCPRYIYLDEVKSPARVPVLSVNECLRAAQVWHIHIDGADDRWVGLGVAADGSLWWNNSERAYKYIWMLLDSRIGRDGAILSIDCDARWEQVLPLLRLVREFEDLPLIVFAEEDRGLGNHHWLPLPAPIAEQETIDISLEGGPPPGAEIEGRSVRITVPGDARAGEVLNLLLELSVRGARGFDFR